MLYEEVIKKTKSLEQDRNEAFLGYGHSKNCPSLQVSGINFACLKFRMFDNYFRKLTIIMQEKIALQKQTAETDCNLSFVITLRLCNTWRTL